MSSDTVGPWRVEFRGDGDVLLLEAVVPYREQAASCLEATLPDVSYRYAGEVKVVLRGPRGEVVEGDEALEGARLARYHNGERWVWASSVRAPLPWEDR